jgi:hypothetical protein
MDSLAILWRRVKLGGSPLSPESKGDTARQIISPDFSVV